MDGPNERRHNNYSQYDHEATNGCSVDLVSNNKETTVEPVKA